MCFLLMYAFVIKTKKSIKKNILEQKKHHIQDFLKLLDMKFSSALL